jgi:F-type H+-transporting ATPase subunit delta
MQASLLQASSRHALGAATDRLNSTLDQLGEADAQRLGEELFEIVRLLATEPTLRRHLADPATAPSARSKLAEALFADKLSEVTMEVLTGLVSARWSQTRDLVDAVETLARLSTLAVAEKDGSLEEVEDELFRVGRLIAREPQLRTLLGDPTAPAEHRSQLLESLVSGKVRPVTERLLVHAVRTPRGRSLDRTAEELAELAASRRQRSVARVTAPTALTDEQEQRLAQTLSTIYRRDISVQVELDPDLLGGLVVQVGDQIIDGSISGRLSAARQRLPG